MADLAVQPPPACPRPRRRDGAPAHPVSKTRKRLRAKGGALAVALGTWDRNCVANAQAPLLSARDVSLVYPARGQPASRRSG